MQGVCYEAAAYVQYLRGGITPDQLQNTLGQGWVDILQFGNGEIWKGGAIERGKAIGFYRLIDNKFFHAAISTGGTTIRAVNGLRLGSGWKGVDLAAVLGQPGEDGTCNYDNTQIRVHISPR